MDVTVSKWLQDDRLRPGCQLFAIGDVHGHPVELDALLASMSAEATPDSLLVLLGDLIDRGPDQPGAIATAAKWLSSSSFAASALLIGNHDLFYYSALEMNQKAVGVWFLNGGRDFLTQVGAQDVSEVRNSLIRKIGLQAVETYEAAETHLEVGNLLLVHAGLDPHLSLELIFAGPKWSDDWRRNDSHWAWIRRPFIEHEGPFEGNRFVVHGHTSEATIQKFKNRELLDPLHRIDGWRLGLDGTASPDPGIAGAEIRNGRYRIYTVAYER